MVDMMKKLIYMDAERNGIYLTEKTVDDCIFERLKIGRIDSDEMKGRHDSHDGDSGRRPPPDIAC